ncbi:hypothetical protein [Halosegnis marinus]|uniref:Uncharacterized protein n=1 Tax=Halosegnis marinus TaxID=3034023 RepID=A0ABD5ZML6_9EURY|nr:hypothetical protein [Halosegnis sp. DT85]
MRIRPVARAAAAVAALFLFVGSGVAAGAALALVSLSDAALDPTLALVVAAAPFLLAPVLAGVAGATARGRPPTAAVSVGLGSLVGAVLFAAPVVGVLVGLADAAGTDPVVAAPDLAAPLALVSLATGVVGAASGYLAARARGSADREPRSAGSLGASAWNRDRPEEGAATAASETEPARASAEEGADESAGSVADLFDDADGTE